MARRTIEQRIAEAQEQERRARERLRKLKAQASEEARRERNHRLIESAAAIESEAKSAGVDGFEVTPDAAAAMARAWFSRANASRAKR